MPKIESRTNENTTSLLLTQLIAQADRELNAAIGSIGVQTDIFPEKKGLSLRTSAISGAIALSYLAAVGLATYFDMKDSAAHGITCFTAQAMHNAFNWIGVSGPEIVELTVDNNIICEIPTEESIAWGARTLTALLGWGSVVGIPVTFLNNLYRKAAAKDQAKKDEVQMKLLELQEGRADLDGQVGPNVQIDVGHSDPAMKPLLRKFKELGTKVVSFYDFENKVFLLNPVWQRTDNDWTNHEILRKGDLREATCSVLLISNGEDIFLASPELDPARKAQDMTVDEAIGAMRARDTLRVEMGLTLIPHILVTNPRKSIDIGIIRTGIPTEELIEIGEFITEEFPNAHIIDPDELVLKKLAIIAGKDDLPIEILTNKANKEEYGKRLTEAIKGYNERSGSKKFKVKVAEAEGGNKTLSIVYGATDSNTIAQAWAFKRKFSKLGDFVAIINDPEKVGRLPPNTKFICVGALVAEAVIAKYSELVDQGISLSN